MKNRSVQRGRSRSARQSATQPETSFFGKESANPFFDMGSGSFFPSASAETVQRKCEKCEEEDKSPKPQAAAAVGAATDTKHKKAEAPAAPEEKEKDKKIMKKDAAEAAAPAGPLALTGADGSGGIPLPSAAAAYFSEAIGHDFSGVRIHTGAEANRSAKAVRAKAYTIGQHIVFREGQYDTGSPAGKWLLAHELTHVAQQDGDVVHREAEPAELPETVTNSGVGPVVYENQRDYANCSGVSVQGHTDANYTHTYSFSSSGQHSTGCEGCGDADCVTNTGTITSVFGANPSVTLPPVPDGLNECETAAVQTFINTTLSAHEQEHVAAFNTFVGTVQTQYTYTGCQSGEEAFVAARHEAIKEARMQASNAASAALDPFNEPIPCNCPDPEPAPESDQSAE